MTAPRTVVVVGASVAGMRCATGLRDAGFDGRVVVLDSDPDAPYDKPQLSKRLTADWVLERPGDPAVLDALGIELRTGVEVTGLDVDGRWVETANGSISYDELVLAVGNRPRHLTGHTPDALPDRVGYLRTRADWERLRSAVGDGTRLIVVGAGFLGIEVAAAARSRRATVTVVDVASQILTRGVARAVADVLAERLRSEGVELRLGVTDAFPQVVNNEVCVDGVHADFALVSIGATPRTDLVDGSGLATDDGVVCDATLQAAPGVWAIGDCARWVNTRYGRPERHEHWTTAVRHGQHVAHSIATGIASPMAELPYVWSDQFDQRIQTVGRVGPAAPEDAEELHLVLSTGGHVVLTVAEGHVTGVTTIDAQARCVRVRQLLQSEDPAVADVLDRLALDTAPVR